MRAEVIAFGGTLRHKSANHDPFRALLLLQKLDKGITSSNRARLADPDIDLTHYFDPHARSRFVASGYSSTSQADK